jgi:hypothetical protein
MRSIASKAPHKLQLDLPLDESRLDPPSSVCSLSSASPGAATNLAFESFVTAPDAGQLDRPVSFPIEPEPVVATRPEEVPRETKLPAGIDTDTNRNLYHSLGISGTTAPHPASTELSMEAVPEVSAPSDPTTSPASPAGRILEGSWSSTPHDAAELQRVDLHTWKELLPLLRGLRGSVEHPGGCPPPGATTSVARSGLVAAETATPDRPSRDRSL